MLNPEAHLVLTLSYYSAHALLGILLLGSLAYSNTAICFFVFRYSM